ncbi:hypothetical protein ACFV1B_15205 [Streptomyces sp. NPDC059637]|uniref:hypothetical protein n=1 Tax=Streptomyces sp. NPDC059637 TaxID=3347752 RepID=UPI0036C226E3
MTRPQPGSVTRPTLHGHTAALRQLVLRATPSVTAGMLGHHTAHAEAVAAEVGCTWKKYAPGEHCRRPHQETGDR